jgi:simple sugar transport system substrate-binding protein
MSLRYLSAEEEKFLTTKGEESKAKKVGRRKFLGTAAVGVAGLVVGGAGGYYAGYSSVPAPPPAPAPEFTFYMVTHGGGSDPFWATVIKGHDNAAARMPVKSTYSAPATYSVAALVDLMNSAIAAKPDGIACTITDPTAMLDPVTRARAAGIPVVAINVNDPAGKVPYMAYIGQSEYDAGRGLAAAVVQYLPQGVHAVVGNQEVGHIGLEQRTKGITDVLKEQLNGTTDELDITNDPTTAATIMQAYLTKNPDVKALFTLGPLGADPAITMLKEQGLAGKLLFATFDLDQTILAAIKDGTCKAANDQQPFDQGWQGVAELYLYCKFHILPVNIPTGPSIITLDNISVVEARIAAGFA